MNVDTVTEGRPVDIVAEGFDAGLRPSEMVPRDNMGAGRSAVTGAWSYWARPPYFAQRPKSNSPST